MIRAASFDVFDSVLVRDALVPSDVFVRVGERLIDAGEAPGISATEFGRLRVQAELVARRKTSHEDVTLEEIWRELAAMLGVPSNERFMQAELAEEAAALAPVAATLRLVGEERAASRRVIFVTDSYFPRSFLEEQLARAGAMAPGDALYISSEVRLTKSGGTLFKHLLAKEGLAPAELRHYGDHPQSDVRVPRRLGIVARRLTVPVLRPNEEALVAPPFAAIRALRDVAAASRQFRQVGHDGIDEGAVEAAAAFLGPFSGLLAAWALDRAKRHGLRRLYFCARDCQMAWKAARILARRAADPIDCRYLLVSRQALFLPSIKSANREELHWLRRPFERPLLDRILAKVELEPADWTEELRGIGRAEADGVVLADESDWKRFWDAMESRPMREAIERKAAERRAAALAYFRSEGLLDAPEAGIVDIGWHLTCQASLRKILEQAGVATVRGFYLQVNGDRLAPSESGPAEFLFSEPAADLQRFVAGTDLHHMDAFLEHVAGEADHGSAVAYGIDEGGTARPILSPLAASDSARRVVASHHAATEAYARRYAARLRAWAGDTALLPLVVHRICDAFFLSADARAVSSLRHLSFSIDQNGRDERPLVEPISWWEAVRPVFPARLLGRGHRDPYYPWPRARRLESSPLKNAAYRMARWAGRARSWLWQRLGQAQ